DLVPRGPGQERDQVLLLVQVVRLRLDPVKEAPPDTLEEVDRVEPRPEETRELAADDQADLRLVTAEKLPRSLLVSVLDPGQELADVARAPAMQLFTRRHGSLPRSSRPVVVRLYLFRPCARARSDGYEKKPTSDERQPLLPTCHLADRSTRRGNTGKTAPSRVQLLGLVERRPPPGAPAAIGEGPD